MKFRKFLSVFMACAVLGTTAQISSGIDPVLQSSAIWEEEFTEGTYEVLTYRAYADRIEIIGCDTSVTEVVIPDEIDGIPVTKIRENAFNYCYSLTSITIPQSVTYISPDFCIDCYSLAEFIVDGENTVYSSLDGVLFNNDKSILIRCPNAKSEEYVIPDNVTTITQGAFRGCDSLRFITIPNSVNQIGGEAFYQCSSLRRIALPEGITYISSKLFYDCYNLAEVTIPDTVKYIYSEAFHQCFDLAEIILPDGVVSIKNGAFSGCRDLDDVIIPASASLIDYDAFNNCNSLDNLIILNPDCEIADLHTTVNNYNSQIYYGAICGYPGSTAQAYAEKYGHTFTALIQGNTDLNGEVSIVDAVKIMTHITTSGGTLSSAEIINADVYQRGDGISNMDALAIQKKLAQLLSDLPESYI
ncbi:MAG: leucine-rich repeat protein [Ruminococcus sp.]|nr:leucine-rich repeat protein [Ruminococcus sp.]